ncbi:hypothetical protein SPI_03057 [Niveomyces insectorum RCEF 264]|uniref:Ubiquitin-like domain-containing protein n=1 Tax=Niveomyces insectorum RCEF 264 TaxID=1081102 RepID=A0A162MN69_9HYPO|nr:hypothetical protein SPI_03057 [Niveomyces insectorum RCEF 264]
MTEIQFAKSFLAALDARPIKLPADYVEDAHGYPSRSPYILPRMPRPMRRAGPAKRVAPGQERSVAVAVKSLHHNPPLVDVQLGALPLATTSLLDVRTALAAATHVPLGKLRLLHDKKPVPDSKVLKDVVAGGSGGGDGDGDGDANDTAAADAAAPARLELTVMVMGGAATVAAAQAAAEAEAAEKKRAAAAAETTKSATATDSSTAPVADSSGGGGTSAVESEAFWNDLRTFLVGRIKDDKQADEVFSLFLRAWEDRMI